MEKGKHMFSSISTLSVVWLLLFLVTPISVFSQSNTPYLKLTSPNGGESWEANSTQTITWQSSNVSKIRIEYSFNNGYSWRAITNSVDASLGQYSWTLPNAQTGGVLVKIIDANNASIYDVSDKSFNLYIVKTTISKPQSLSKITAGNTSTAIKIMPFGDSITDGEGDDPNWDTTSAGYIAVVGYREKLFDTLENAGYNFRFVGTRFTGYDNVPNNSVHYGTNFYNFGRYNEGHGGWNITPGDTISLTDSTFHWLTQLSSHNPSDEPDVIIYMGGTNEFSNYPTPAQVNVKEVNLLDTLNLFDPKIRIMFATIIYYSHNATVYGPGTDGDRFSIADQATLRSDMMTDADSLISLGRNISLVDMNSVLSESDYPAHFSSNTLYFYTPTSDTGRYNDVHPNRAGYDKMAIAWFDSLKSYLPVLRLKVFLQGPYDSTSQLMTTSLRHFYNGTNYVDLLPPKSPYKDTLNHSAYLNANDTVVIPYSIPTDITDWIQIEIRSSTSSTSVIERKSCFLRDDGQVIDPDGMSENVGLGIPPGYYYIVVKHRNHLAIMSRNLVQLNGLTSYDFTTDTTQAYGANAMVAIGNGNFGMIGGDYSQDGYIDIRDFIGPDNDRFLSGYKLSDLNMDGYVDIRDFILPDNNRFKQTEVPSN